MMQYTQQPNRIAAEDLDEVTTWKLPEIDDRGLVVSSAEKEERERQAALCRQEQEKIEDVEMTPAELPQGGMTAQDMQEIFDAAEKDGFAQGHEQGVAQGHQEGYEAGRQQGLMEMRQQLVLEQQRFHGIAEALLTPLAEQDQDIEKLLVDIVTTLTASVVQRELQTDSSHILLLVQQAIDVLPAGSKNLRILVSPDDLPTLQDYTDQHQLDWKPIADARVQSGGCVVETPESRVDFSVAQRLAVVLEQFRSKQLGTSEVEKETMANPASTETAVVSPSPILSELSDSSAVGDDSAVPHD